MHKIVQDKSIYSQLTTLKSEEKEQTIVFFPMVHVGTQEYFDGIKYVVDSLRQQGFVAFYEGIAINDKKTDSLTLDTLTRKLRKVLRVNVMGGYKEENKSLPKAMSYEKHITQDYEYLGVGESFGDKWVDLELGQLINAYEERHGEIELTDCDFTTGLLEKYKCKRYRKRSKHSMFHTYRDNHLFNTIINSKQKKIMVIYGKAHANWIVADLTKNGYILTQKGKCIY